MTTKYDTLQAPAPRLLYSRAEAARQLSISVRSLDYLLASKTFQTRRIGENVPISAVSRLHTFPAWPGSLPGLFLSGNFPILTFEQRRVDQMSEVK
jgi:hypothetical protein